MSAAAACRAALYSLEHDKLLKRLRVRVRNSSDEDREVLIRRRTDYCWSIRTHLPRAASHEATFIVTFGDQLFGRLNVIDRCFLCTGVVFR
jgi:hypothetical protein